MQRLMDKNLSVMEKRLEKKLVGRDKKILKKMEELQQLLRGVEETGKRVAVKDAVVKKKVEKVVAVKSAAVKRKKAAVSKAPKKARSTKTVDILPRRVSPRFVDHHSGEPTLQETLEELRLKKKARMTKEMDAEHKAALHEPENKNAEDIVRQVLKEVLKEVEKKQMAEGVEEGRDHIDAIEVMGAGSEPPTADDVGGLEGGNGTDIVLYESPEPLSIDKTFLIASPEVAAFIKNQTMMHRQLMKQRVKRVIKHSQYQLSLYTDPTRSHNIQTEFNPLREVVEGVEVLFAKFYMNLKDEKLFDLPTCAANKK